MSHPDPTPPAAFAGTSTRPQTHRRRLVAALTLWLSVTTVACRNQGVGVPEPAPGSTILTLLPIENRRLDLGAEHRGTFSTSDLQFGGSRFQAWALEVEAGIPMVVDLSSIDFSPTLHLVGPDVERMSTGVRGSTRLCFESESGGTYRAVTSTDIEASGTYVIRVRAATDADMRACGDTAPLQISEDELMALLPTFPTEGTLGSGDSLSGEFFRGHGFVVGDDTIYVQAWTFEGRADESIVVKVSSEDFKQLAVLVLGLDFSEDGETDDGRLSMVARLPTVGEYRVIVAAPEGPGRYTIQFAGSSGSGAGTMLVTSADELPIDGRLFSPDTSIVGVLSFSDPIWTSQETRAQAWQFFARAGQSVTLELRSEDFDPVLYVVGNGVEESDDDSAGEYDSRITFDVLATGDYRAIVTGFSEEDVGGFTLLARLQAPADLANLPVAARRLRPDTLVTGSLTVNDQPHEDTFVQAWALPVLKGDSILLDLESTDFDAFLYVRGPDLERENDDSGSQSHARIGFQAHESGTYRVIASSLTGRLGTYTLRSRKLVFPDLTTLATGGRTLLRDSVFAGEWSANDPTFDTLVVQAWHFHASEGDSISLVMSVSPNVFGARLYVFGSGMVKEEGLINRSGNIRATFLAPATGEYRAIVSSLPSEAGCFRLLLSHGQSPIRMSEPDCEMERFRRLTPEHTLNVPDRRGTGWHLATSWDLTGEQRDAEGRPLQAWVLYGEPGDSLTVDLISDEFDPVLYGFDADRDYATINDDGAGSNDSRLLIRFPKSGRYQLIASTSESRPLRANRNCYTLILWQRRSTESNRPAIRRPCESFRPITKVTAEGSLDTGVVVLGELRTTADRERVVAGWELDLTTWRPNRPMVIRLHSDDFDPRLYVVDLKLGPFGTSVDTDGADRCNGALVALERPSRYLIVAAVDSSDWQTGNSFRIHASERRKLEAPHDCVHFLRSLVSEETLAIGTMDSVPTTLELRQAGTGTSKSYGAGVRVNGQPQTRQGVLTPEEPRKSYFVGLGRLETASITLTSQDFDAHVSVIGRDTIVSADDGGGGCNARLVLDRGTLEALGNPVHVVVTSFRPRVEGAYRLNIAAQSNELVKGMCDDVHTDFRRLSELEARDREIRVDDLASGQLTVNDKQLNDGTYVQAWTLSAAKGDTMTVDLRSDEFDSFLHAAGPGIYTLTDDDGGGRCDARITWVAPKAGWYRIVVSTISIGRTGAFELTAFNGTPPPVRAGECNIRSPNR